MTLHQQSAPQDFALRWTPLFAVLLAICLSTLSTAGAFVPPTTTDPVKNTLTSRIWKEMDQIDAVGVQQSHRPVLPHSNPTHLFSKKKTASTSSASASSKVQVRLLQHIAGTGQAGEVILVTPAFYNNKLRPQHLAEPISDDEVKAMKAKQSAQQQATLEAANRLQEQLSHDGDGGDNFVLTFSDNKTGPDGKKLFGGISSNKVLQHLQEMVGDPYLTQKQVKVLEITSTETGEKLRGDIKETGAYVVKLQLTKDIPVEIQVEVEASSEE